MKTEARVLLGELEEEGNVLFHGSGYKMEIIEPRQAYNFVDGEKIPDGKPGVHTTPFADIAVFMAIVNENNLKGFKSGFSHTNKGLSFRMTEKSRDQISKSVTGYVYTLPKEKFTKRSDAEYISYDSVSPIKTIEVTGEDLPENINIIPEENKN